jgi:membrane fusion protein, multidrug efflux system
MQSSSTKLVRAKENSGKENSGKGPSAPEPSRSSSLMAVPLRHGRSLLAGSQRHWGKIVGVLAVLAVAGATYAYWHYATLHPSTDDAYVEANTVQISPSLSGEVGEVDVKSFDTVKAGDVLLKISQPQLEAQLKAAEAGLQAAQAKRANVEVAQTAVAQARAALDTATIKSPVDGIVGKISIRPGSVVRAGVPILAIVDGSKWWVDANFKETDLARIHPGQKATVSIDIYPDREFSGVVEAVSPMSTSAFSLLPAENATGNWIKLTQRFPVRVSLSLKPDDPTLRIGASANVTIDTTDKGAN